IISQIIFLSILRSQKITCVFLLNKIKFLINFLLTPLLYIYIYIYIYNRISNLPWETCLTILTNVLLHMNK
ncbi:MAG: hypothetical protein N7Q72_02880, partial [Spiroplasma sp. Tabriz.8]|nr:hypothetical protein [Spiroplasma sp. Tabriz.8]